jgi:hypothetical protein
MSDRRFLVLAFLLVSAFEVAALHQLGKVLRIENENRRLIAGLEANYDASAEFRRLSK